MTLSEALDIVIARTGHIRYRDLCDSSWPDHEAYRRLVLDLAEHNAPSLITQAVNAVEALGRMIGAVVAGEAVLVSEEVYQGRLAICQGEASGVPCEWWESPTGRCNKCGCYAVKFRIATERCPIGKWESVSETPSQEI